MNCKECRRFLEDYHDGELGGRDASLVESHIAECKACADELAILKSESELFERYRISAQSEIGETPPGWDALREKIMASPEHARGRQAMGDVRHGWWNLFSGPYLIRQVAFAVVLVVLSVSTTLLVVNRNRGIIPAPADSVARKSVNPEITPAIDSGNTGLESAMNAVRRAEREYIQAIQLLSESVDRRIPTLDPTLAAKFRKHLKAIDENIAETRKAYYERPTDPDLAQFMLAAYSRKVELLQQMVT
jgi:hypothetical protein